MDAARFSQPHLQAGKMVMHILRCKFDLGFVGCGMYLLFGDMCFIRMRVENREAMIAEKYL